MKAPALEVLSVKQNNSGKDDGAIGLRADGVFAKDTPLRFMIEVAFRRQFASGQMTGLPAWADADHFDLLGKVSGADIPKLHGLDSEHIAETRSALLQTALIERFQLKTHIEEREGPVYALITARGGVKIKSVGANAPPAMKLRNGQSAALGLTAMTGEITGHAISMKRLVEALLRAGQLDRTVVDRTGLSGDYDFELRWTPEQAGTTDGSNTAADANLPSLFTAIQEQLGLKLESAKGPIRTLVIDHVEKPSEN